MAFVSRSRERIHKLLQNNDLRKNELKSQRLARGMHSYCAEEKELARTLSLCHGVTGGVAGHAMFFYAR